MYKSWGKNKTKHIGVQVMGQQANNVRLERKASECGQHGEVLTPEYEG